MSWRHGPAAQGLVGLLRAEAPEVAAFEAPSATFNVPAFVCQYPTLVVFDTRAFGVDVVTWPLLVAVGLEQAGQLDALIATARAAITLDPTLGGAVQIARPTESRNWRILNVAGAEYLGADLVLETRM